MESEERHVNTMKDEKDLVCHLKIYNIFLFIIYIVLTPGILF